MMTMPLFLERDMEQFPRNRSRESGTEGFIPGIPTRWRLRAMTALQEIHLHLVIASCHSPSATVKFV
jgi:hypothetical protein